ncbi:ClpXP protease specificity-enhancing factor [Halomonas denitrificans]|nr:ClpXP protease specificity-enhancing factor [Halomonas denitrificans]
MTSSRPYLLRALYEWIVDNGATPQILVDATADALEIPASVRSGDKVVLNIAPEAVRDLEIDDGFVSFVARFSGVSHGVVVPIDAVLAVYTRENGQGMMFPESGPAGPAADSGDAPPPGPRPVRGADPGGDGSGADEGDSGRDDGPDDDPDSPGGSGRGKPNLKVVK